ncbi:MAG: nucleotidyl transferase AbiEii/AbiGii toxin family protein [Chitinophagales bacterium]
MISSNTFSKEHIESFKNQSQYSKINRSVLEKMIHALGLLEQLRIFDLNFIFKGGTSLSLLLPNFNRLSIDIDIITEHTNEELENAFEKIIQNSHFKRFERQKRESDRGKIPKAHYAFFYEGHFGQKEDKVLLDILFEQSPYPKTQILSIESQWLLSDSNPPQQVCVPTIESILGDKLTAYAPNTTGIPYQVDKSMEIIKQLFDVGLLFEIADDMGIVVQSFTNTVLKEIGYRNQEITIEDVLDDIIETGLLLAKRDRNKETNDIGKIKELSDGIKSVDSHLPSTKFRIEHAIEAAGKAAYLAAKIKANDLNPIPKFDKPYKTEFITNQNYSILNKQKKQPTKAFAYWYEALKLLNLVN